MLVLNQATANMGAACPCSGKWKPVSQWHSRHSVEQHGSVPYDEIGNSGITALWPSGDLCMKYRLCCRHGESACLYRILQCTLMPRESDIDSSIGEKAAGSGRSVLMELEVRRSPGEDIAFQRKKKPWGARAKFRAVDIESRTCGSSAGTMPDAYAPFR